MWYSSYCTCYKPTAIITDYGVIPQDLKLTGAANSMRITKRNVP